jgi:glycosyltransferase involved in cell wall biosynthesis
MTRVLFVTNNFPPDYTGGAEVSLYHTCRGLMAGGVACRILHVNNRRRTSDDAYQDVDGIPVHRVQYGTRWPWQDIVDRRVVDAVRREIRAFSPDLVHIHNVSGASLAPFVACEQETVPAVCTLHDHWLLCPNNMLYRQDGHICDPAAHPVRCGHCLRGYDYWADVPGRRTLFARLTANTRRFLAPSQALIAQHIAAGFAPSRFRRIPHGIEDRPVPEAGLSPAVAQACAAAQARPTLLFAGGGVEIKGALTVLRALPLLTSQIDDLLVIVAGDGDPGILHRLRRFAPSVQVLGKVPFTQMRSLYASADLVLFPSVWQEAYSMVIYEAFQTGTPAAGSAIGAVPELVAHGERGYLFPPRDAGGLAASVIGHFDKSAPERRRMRHRCRQYAATQLSLARHVALLREAYGEALH